MNNPPIMQQQPVPPPQLQPPQQQVMPQVVNPYNQQQPQQQQQQLQPQQQLQQPPPVVNQYQTQPQPGQVVYLNTDQSCCNAYTRIYIIIGSILSLIHVLIAIAMMFNKENNCTLFYVACGMTVMLAPVSVVGIYGAIVRNSTVLRWFMLLRIIHGLLDLLLGPLIFAVPVCKGTEDQKQFGVGLGAMHVMAFINEFMQALSAYAANRYINPDESACLCC